ncbi:MAG: NrdH-redoxin [Firmicutes bacterium]|jgi:glutaredoxin-like YruB-family protein|nr:NrdH-redoxin [Bacillota bacterium]
MAKVKIYSLPTCPYCDKAKAFLDAYNINYEEINVATDKEGMEEMIEKTGQMGVPVLEIDDQIVIGFDRRKISELLGLAE